MMCCSAVCVSRCCLAQSLLDASPSASSPPAAHWLVLQPDRFTSSMEKQVRVSSIACVADCLSHDRVGTGHRRVRARARLARAQRRVCERAARAAGAAAGSDVSGTRVCVHEDVRVHTHALVRAVAMSHLPSARVVVDGVEWPRQPVRRRAMRTECESLLQSPPPARVRCDLARAGSQKTKTIADSLYPQWYESLLLNTILPEPLDQAPRVRVAIYHRNEITRDDFMGQVCTVCV
jgi:hypothetical protein